MSQPPATRLAAVLVAVQAASDIRRTLATLRRQRLAGQIELLLVAEDASLFDALGDEETACFGSVKALSWGRPIDNVDVAAAIGIRAACSPVVAVIEDHVYLEPDWAEHVLAAHEQHEDIVGVGCAVALANRPAALHWANHLFALSRYTPPVRSGPVARVSRHHVAYKRRWLCAHDRELEGLLKRGGGMVEKAAGEGGLYMAGSARLYHLACGFWGESLRVRVASGRLKGSATRGHGLIGTLVACLRLPQIAWQRLRGMLPKILRLRARSVGVFAAASVLLAAECWGYLVGVLAGAGGAYACICQHEYRREQGVRASDIHELNRRWPVERPG